MKFPSLTPKNISLFLPALFSASFLSGCASEEKVLVDTVPSNAQCRIFHDGINGRSFSTPALVPLERPRHVDINCVKNGYQIADISEDAHVNKWFYFTGIPYAFTAVCSGILFPFGVIGTTVTSDGVTNSSLESGHLDSKMYRHHKGPWVIDLKELPAGSENISLPVKPDLDHPQRLR